MAKGAHWLRKPQTETYRPVKKIQKHNETMFHDSTPAYRILFNASATWEWQLSQHRLCMRLLPPHKRGTRTAMRTSRKQKRRRG